MKKILGVLCVVLSAIGVWLAFHQEDKKVTNGTAARDSTPAVEDESESRTSGDRQKEASSGKVKQVTMENLLATLGVTEAGPDETVPEMAVDEPAEDSNPGINATLEGYVVDAITGEPVTEFEFGEIRGAYSYMVQSSASTRSFQKAQNAEGRFVVENIDRAFTFILVQAAGYEPYFIQVGNIQPDEHFVEVEVRLNPASEVFGLVVDLEGIPVGGAAIVLGALFIQGDGSTDRAKAFSDANGGFRLDIVPTGARVSAYKEGYSVGSGVVADDGDGVRAVTITLSEGGIVEGVVTRGGVPQVGNVYA